jgi:acyl-coenzyme A thioesterase PaaI-like protein
MSWTAITMLKRIILTKSMTVDFMKPIRVGNELMVEGKVLEQTSEREALMEGLLYNRDGETTARSQGAFALFTPEAAIRLKIMNAEAVQQFEPLFEAFKQ